MEEQKIGWCLLEKRKIEFAPTIPKGKWVCTNCRFTTTKILEKPIIKIKEYNYL